MDNDTKTLYTLCKQVIAEAQKLTDAGYGKIRIGLEPPAKEGEDNEQG